MKKVLIAEDSSVIQNLAKKILEFQNFEIHSVKNGQQVLDAMEKEDFDICLAHFDANVALLNKQYEKAYYKFSVPQNYSELFEIEINQELK